MKSTKLENGKTKKLQVVEPGKTSPATFRQTIFTRLKADHNDLRSQMKNMLRFVDQTRLDDAKALSTGFQISFHAHAEGAERSLYSVLMGKNTPLLADQIREAGEERHITEILMNELSDLQPSDPKWKAKLRVLCRILDAHLKNEEKFVKKWRKQVSRDECSALLTRFLNVKSSVLRESDLAGGLATSLSLLLDRGILLARH